MSDLDGLETKEICNRLADALNLACSTSDRHQAFMLINQARRAIVLLRREVEIAQFSIDNFPSCFD